MKKIQADKSIHVAHLTISPAFFDCLGPPNRLPDVKVIADIKVQHLHDTVYEPSTHIDLIFNSAMSSTSLLLTAMNTLFFVLKGEYIIYITPDITSESGDDS